MNNLISRVREFFRIRTYPLETHKQRARRYRHITQRALWVGAGLLGLIGLISAGVLDEAPHWLRALVVTFVVLGGAGLAQTRVRFEWRETVINRKIEDNPAIANTALSDDLKRFPKLGFPIWLVALWAIIIAGALTLVSAWWPVETPAHERGGGLTSEMRDRIAFLERELDRRADETTELRRIIETRTCRTPEIEPPREAPSDALPGSGASGGTGTGD